MKWSCMEDSYRLITHFERHGFTQLGSGMYSTVLAKGPLVPGSRCIKVGTDRTWEPYVIWAQGNGFAGNFAPKVYAFHRWGAGLFTASMERLTITVARCKDRTLHSEISYIRREGWDNIEKRFPGFILFTQSALAAGFSGDWSLNNWMLHVYPDGRERLVLIDPQSGNCAPSVKRWHTTDAGFRVHEKAHEVHA